MTFYLLVKKQIAYLHQMPMLFLVQLIWFVQVELFDLCYLLGPKERIIIRIIEDTYSKKKNKMKRKEKKPRYIQKEWQRKVQPFQLLIQNTNYNKWSLIFLNSLQTNDLKKKITWRRTPRVSESSSSLVLIHPREAKKTKINICLLIIIIIIFFWRFFFKINEKSRK